MSRTIEVRFADLAAILAWLTALVLAVLRSVGFGVDVSWCVLAAAAAGALTITQFCERQYAQLQGEAFERGMDAARHGLVDIRDYSQSS